MRRCGAVVGYENGVPGLLRAFQIVFQIVGVVGRGGAVVAVVAIEQIFLPVTIDSSQIVGSQCAVRFAVAGDEFDAVLRNDAEGAFLLLGAVADGDDKLAHFLSEIDILRAFAGG